MKAKVWFTPLKNKEPADSVAQKVVHLADCAGLAAIVPPDGLVAILQHVGEGRNIGYVKPPVTAAVAARIAELKGKPFLTGTSTLYTGRRSNARDHLQQAYDHGFTPEAIGCPIVMADGLRGADRVAVKVPGAKHCPTAYLGSAVAQTEALVAITHPTGHVAAGYGAAIKNVSMGLASRGGKMAMHHGGRPILLAERCTACGRCGRWCPAGAIVVEKKARLIETACIGCGQCLSVCPAEAIDFEWKQGGQAFQERLVEYAAAAQAELKGRTLFVNVIQHFTEGCDCFDKRAEAVCPDVGIVASRDLVAADAATADRINLAAGKDLVGEIAGRDYRGMLAYAEQLGLGSRDYEVVDRRP